MTAEKFEDFCVAGKELFLVQNNSHKVYTLLNWEEYGLRITIPHEAVPLYDTVEIAITALVGGEFILPEDTELVSAVYAISVSKQFLKPVQLEIQHCVSIEKPADSNYLSFATASSDQPPYQFKPVEGGEFPIGSRYGSIYITEFSLWIIKKFKRFTRRFHRSISSPTHQSPPSLTPTATPSPTNRYFGQVMYENNRPGREWLMIFLLCKDLNALSQVCLHACIIIIAYPCTFILQFIDKNYELKRSTQIPFQFENTDGFIELCFDAKDREERQSTDARQKEEITDCSTKGWSIRPHQKPTRVSILFYFVFYMYMLALLYS